MKYYAHKDSGKPAPSSDLPINNPDLIEVPHPAVNQYQTWDGQAWLGSEKTLEERYGSFRVAMLNSAGWQRIKALAASAVPEFMGAIAYMDDNPGMVKYLWNAIINNLPAEYQPTATEIADWKAIVTAIEIGIDRIGDRELSFDFTDEGMMI